MLRSLTQVGLLLAVGGCAASQPPVRVESAPSSNSLLTITQEAALHSAIGGALESRLGPDDIELRVWSGYGLGQTYGMIIRRKNGVWRGWSAELLGPDPDSADAEEIAAKPLPQPSSRIARAWDEAMKAGVLTLPPEVARTWRMFDGLHYVVELRRGNVYRASVIAHVVKPEVPADRQIQAVIEAIEVLRDP